MDGPIASVWAFWQLFGVGFAGAEQPVENPPLALGGTPGPGITPAHRRVGRPRSDRGQVVEQPARIVGRSAARRIAGDLQKPHPSVERDGHDIAKPDHAARCHDPHAIDPYMTGGHQIGGGASGAHHAGVPQPFVDALAIHAKRRLSP
jgi:hypothetical protein